MINMKIENMDGKIVIYLYNEEVDINDLDRLKKKIKDLFVKIMERGNYDFFGYNKVSIYHNEFYGIILEVEKIYNSDFNYHTIDLKIVIYKNIPMYFVFDDYYEFEKNEVKILHNMYYLEINDKINIYKYIEYGRINYKKILNKID